MSLHMLHSFPAIKTHNSESRGQEAEVRNE